VVNNVIKYGQKVKKRKALAMNKKKITLEKAPK